MQTRNPFLDEFAKMGASAMGLAQAAGEEARSAFRAQTDRVAAELDLVRRDEFDAMKAEVALLRAAVAGLIAQTAPNAHAAPAAGAPETGTQPPASPAPDAAA